MLKRGKFKVSIVLLLLLSACSDNQYEHKEKIIDEDDLRKKAIFIVGTENDYKSLYVIMSDTLSSWYLNNLLADTAKDESTQFKLSISEYIIDSLFVVNSRKNKLIGSVYHAQQSKAKIWSDEKREFFGTKINSKWYFWMGASNPIIRKNQKKAVSYKEFHSSGVASLTNSIDKNGNIKDEWFEIKFSGGGWTTYRERYKYKWILDGNRIDNENDYWDYIWKRKGLNLWITKISEDSIANYENYIGKRLETKEKMRLACFFQRKWY